LARGSNSDPHSPPGKYSPGSIATVNDIALNLLLGNDWEAPNWASFRVSLAAFGVRPPATARPATAGSSNLHETSSYGVRIADTNSHGEIARSGRRTDDYCVTEKTIGPRGAAQWLGRRSVSGWQTFPDLRLTCDHFVDKVSTSG